MTEDDIEFSGPADRRRRGGVRRRPVRLRRRVRPVHDRRRWSARARTCCSARRTSPAPSPTTSWPRPTPPTSTRSELQKLVDAWYLTLDWIEANPDEATAIMAEQAGGHAGGVRGVRRGHDDLRRRSRRSTPSPTGPATRRRCPRWPGASTRSWSTSGLTEAGGRPRAACSCPQFTAGVRRRRRRVSAASPSVEPVAGRRRTPRRSAPRRHRDATGRDGRTGGRAGAARAAVAEPATRGRRQHPLGRIRSPLGLGWRIALGAIGVAAIFARLAACCRGALDDAQSFLVPTPGRDVGRLHRDVARRDARRRPRGVAAARRHRLRDLDGDRRRARHR